MEQRAALYLCCGADDVFEFKGVRIGRTVEIAGDAAFRAIYNEISSVRVNMQLHITSKEAEYCVW
eukprot:15339355-Ditylum_brightwellii.AAC.1